MHLRTFPLHNFLCIDRQSQKRGFIPGAADGLHADGEAGFCVSCWKGDRRQAGHVGGGGEAHDLDGGGQVRVTIRQCVFRNGRRGDAGSWAN